MKSNITKEEVLKYFETIDKATHFYILGIDNLRADIKRMEKHPEGVVDIRKWFGQDLLTTSINNRPISELMDKFRVDVIKVLESQIQEQEEMIKHLKSL
jgi:hypothetical protein